MNRSRILILLLFALLIGIFSLFDFEHLLTLETLKAQQTALKAWRSAHPILAAASYFTLYVAVVALSLPLAAVLSLAGGAVFGLVWGALLVSFAASLGSTLAFLVARFVLRDFVRQRFGDRLQAIDRGLARDGIFYLFALRLVPVFPLFVINLAMGLTAMPARTFYWVSQLGVLPGTIVYVNAGTQLAKINSLADILSPQVFCAFALLGVFPLLAKQIVDLVKAKKVYARWLKPKRFDCNLLVVGAGSAGLSAAYLGAALKAKVALVEKERMGGDCLNTGCVPSKALIRTTRLVAQIQRAPELGIRKAHAEFDFAEVMERVQRVIRAVAPHDSADRYLSLGVEVIEGKATFLSPWEVRVKTSHGEHILAARTIVIATGARPLVPKIAGLEEIGYLTSDTVWGLRELPQRLLVLGGGPIGCELAQCFARLGSRVTLVERQARLLGREDPEASELVAARFRAEGIDLRLAHKALKFLKKDREKVLLAEHAGKEVLIPFDQVLVALGRCADTEGLGLETLGIPTTPQGTVEVDELLRTCYPNLYACGDVAGPYQFTHFGAYQAQIAVLNALFGNLWKTRADYSVIPWATFTDPEVARVGLNEQEAKAQGIAYEVTRYELKELDRAIADGETSGFVKVITPPGKDRILGVTIVGASASDLIAEFVLAIKHRIGLNRILGTIHIYPTLAEANKYAAGMWRQAHTPRWLFSLLEHYHAWRRG